MKISPISFFIFVACAISAQASIDLTPVPSERVLAGIKFPKLNFREDGRLITYEPPRNWRYTGGGQRLRLTPPELAQAHGEIDQIPLREPQEFNEETLKAIRENTLAALPQGNQHPEIVSEAVNAFAVNGHGTYELTVSYEAYGEKFMTAVVYVNMPTTQLRFRTVARAADFEKVHEAFRISIFSWQWR